MKRQGMLGLAGALTLACVPAADAAEVIGSHLEAANATFAVDSTVVQITQESGYTLPVQATKPGVITAITLRHGSSGANPGTYGFRILTQATGNELTARRVDRVPDFPGPANFAGTGGYIHAVPRDAEGLPKGVPMAAGERIGLTRSGGMAGEGLIVLQVNGVGVASSTAAVHNEGLRAYTPFAKTLMLQATIEPDADGDGYGDESQDRCPADASGPCIPPRTVNVPGPTVTVTNTVTVPAPVAAKTCKVPSKLKNKTLAAATTALKKAGCTAKPTVKRPKGKTKKGYVLRVSKVSPTGTIAATRKVTITLKAVKRKR